MQICNKGNGLLCPQQNSSSAEVKSLDSGT